jgi:hypothetical protein
VFWCVSSFPFHCANETFQPVPLENWFQNIGIIFWHMAGCLQWRIGPVHVLYRQRITWGKKNRGYTLSSRLGCEPTISGFSYLKTVFVLDRVATVSHQYFYNITSLLVPGDPGRLGTHICVFTVESPPPVVARHFSCIQLLWKPHDPSKEGAPIYLVTFETSWPMSRGTVHVSSYCGNSAIRAGKAHAFPYFPRKPRDV